MSHSKKKTSMRDVAHTAGVHVTTVSLALRNSPQLPLKTRQRIQEIARQIGYRPNPLVVALVEQRRRSSANASLGFISRMSSDQRLKNSKFTESLYQGVSQRAHELGFNIDAFDLADYGDDARRLQKTLRHRNIRGLIISPLPQSREILDFDWEQLAVVAFGHSLVLSGVDRVDSDHFGGTWLAMKNCERLGYCRPGFVSLRRTDERTQGRWRGGYLAYLPQRKSFTRLPTFVEDDDVFSTRFKSWISRYKPDVIIGNSSALEACEQTLASSKINPRPEFVRLNIHQRENPMKGIYTGVEVRAQLATDILAAKLYRNEVGSQEYPKEIHTPAIWHPGH